VVEPGFSPHTFDLKPSDMININKSDLLISTGFEIDNFIVKNNTAKDHIELKDSLTLIEGHDHSHHDHGHGKHEDEHNNEHHDDHEAEHHEEGSHENHHDEHHDEHEDEHHDHEDEHNEESHEEHHDDHDNENNIFYDPHVWLSLDNAKVIAQISKDKFIALDSQNTQYYEDNYKSFVARVDEMKTNHLERVKDKKINHFVIFHDAYGYLFKEFEIDPDYAIALEETAGREPSAAEMKNILDTIALNNVKVLYREPQFDTKLVDTLANNQYNLEVKILDPLGNSVEKNGYLDNIQQNLNNLLAIYE
jgi:zinc transport system substrate-binding protein